MPAENPYQPPREVDFAAPPAVSRRRKRLGPAIPIALGAALGSACATILFMRENPWGLIAIPIGAVAGGLRFRMCSHRWPIDTTAKRRRHKYALLSVVVFPMLIAFAVGLRAQGLQMTLLVFLIGVSIAVGMFAAGDRRDRTPVD